MADQINVNEHIEVGDLGVGEPDPGNETVVEADTSQNFDVAVDTDDRNTSRDDEYAMDVTEAAAADIAEDGTLITTLVSAVVDEASGLTMIDELVGVVMPDGTGIADERLSVVDAEGNFAVVSEGLEVVGA